MYRIPREEEVRKALYVVLKRNDSIESLKKLRDEVLKELKKINKDYRISIRRCRVIAAHSGFVKIEVKKGHGNKKMRKCPICGNKLTPIKSISLLGETVVTGYKCGLCGYRGGIDEMPVRYEFHLTR